MDGSIRLKPSERKTLLEYYCRSADPTIARHLYRL
jgi:hypothetical protein